jgi:hypothetical protein
MPKRRSRAEIRVADGTGGMLQLHDQRFRDDWSVQFSIPKEAAGGWMRYLSAECERRDWNLAGLSQHERKEDSGTVTISQHAKPVIVLVWERKRGGAMIVRARSEALSELPSSDVQQLLEQVTARCVARETQEFFRWGCLEYEGLPWRGELWLNDKLRLGPPSEQYETALRGPRVVLVSGLVQAVSAGDAGYVFEKELQELGAFLSVIMRTSVDRTKQRQVWTCEVGADGTVIKSLRSIGTSSSTGRPKYLRVALRRPSRCTG